MKPWCDRVNSSVTPSKIDQIHLVMDYLIELKLKRLFFFFDIFPPDFWCFVAGRCEKLFGHVFCLSGLRRVGSSFTPKSLRRRWAAGDAHGWVETTREEFNRSVFEVQRAHTHRGWVCVTEGRFSSRCDEESCYTQKHFVVFVVHLLSWAFQRSWHGAANERVRTCVRACAHAHSPHRRHICDLCAQKALLTE